MKNTWLLLKIQIFALLGFNKILRLKDKRERRKKILARAAIALCLLAAWAGFAICAFLFGYAMDALGQIGLLPGLMLAIVCVLTLFSSASMASETLFNFKDYELVMSLPVQPVEIASSRLWLVYLCNSAIDLLAMIPCGAAYAYFARPPFAFYPIFLLTTLAAPIVPMIIGGMIGAVTMRLIVSLPGAKYIRMMASTALSLGIMYLSFSMDGYEESALFGNFGMLVSRTMNRIYPLTGLYTSAVRDLDWGAAFWFVLSATVFMAGATLIMGRWMKKINATLNGFRSKSNFRMRALNTSSPLTALYKKELKRYLGSAVWLFNTAFSLALAAVGLGAAIVKGRTAIRMVLTALDIAGFDERMIVYGLGYIGAFLVATACTTSCSISLEGNQVRLIQSLPVSGFQVLLSKIMVNLTLTVPISFVVGVGIGWTLKLNAADVVTTMMMLLGYSLASACIGLFVNLKNHSFDWTNEATVVKQSAASGMTLLLNMALVAVPAVLTIQFMDCAFLIFILTILFAFGLGGGFLLLFKMRGDRWIRAL